MLKDCHVEECSEVCINYYSGSRYMYVIINFVLVMAIIVKFFSQEEVPSFLKGSSPEVCV